MLLFRHSLLKISLYYVFTLTIYFISFCICLWLSLLNGLAYSSDDTPCGMNCRIWFILQFTLVNRSFFLSLILLLSWALYVWHKSLLLRTLIFRMPFKIKLLNKNLFFTLKLRSIAISSFEIMLRIIIFQIAIWTSIIIIVWCSLSPCGVNQFIRCLKLFFLSFSLS